MATKLFIRCGQSNSLGNGTMSPLSGLDASFKTTFANIQTWTGSAFASLNYAVNNNQFPVANQNSGGACEFALLKGAQEHFNEVIYDLKGAQGSTHLGTVTSASLNWNASTRGSYLDALVSQLNKAMNYLWNTLGERSFDIYVIWIQGESDANEGTGAEANAYATNLTALLNKIKGQFGTNINSCNFYPIIVDINTTTTWPFQATVLAAEASVVATYPNAYGVPVTGFTIGADNLHYTNAGNKALGEYIVNNIIIANNL